MRHVFIDAGSFDGRTVRLFRRHYPRASAFEIHCFEPDPRFRDHYCGLGVQFRPQAAWTHDGEIDFYLGDPESSTLIAEKSTGHVDQLHPVRVPCIDFSRWLAATFDADDVIVIKLNVEGAEYAVLRRMLDDGTICLVRELFVEWHWNRIGLSRREHDLLVERLVRVEGLRTQSIWGTDWLTSSRRPGPGVA